MVAAAACALVLLAVACGDTSGTGDSDAVSSATLPPGSADTATDQRSYDATFDPGPSSIPCTEDELEYERAHPSHDGNMLGFTEILVRVTSIEVIGAMRFDDGVGEDIWGDGKVCQTWVTITAEQVLHEDYTFNMSERDYPPLPAAPFVLTAYDTYGLVSVERGFDDVQRRTKELVVGLHRGPSATLAAALGEDVGFLLTLIATEDATEVFNPDPDIADAASHRFTQIRDRLDLSDTVDLVTAYRELVETGQWLELFADLYPEFQEHQEPSWHDLPPDERSLGYEGGLPDDVRADMEAIGLDIQINYIEYEPGDSAGTLSFISEAGRGHNFSLATSVESHLVPTIRLPGEELVVAWEDAHGRSEIEVGRVTGIDRGQIAVIRIDTTPDDVRITSITSRPPTDLELQAAASYGINPDGTLGPSPTDRLAQPDES